MKEDIISESTLFLAMIIWTIVACLHVAYLHDLEFEKKIKLLEDKILILQSNKNNNNEE